MGGAPEIPERVASRQGSFICSRAGRKLKCIQEEWWKIGKTKSLMRSSGQKEEFSTHL